MARVFDDEILTKYSLYGFKKKSPFSKLLIYRVIIGKNILFVTVKNYIKTEFCVLASYWDDNFICIKLLLYSSSRETSTVTHMQKTCGALLPTLCGAVGRWLNGRCVKSDKFWSNIGTDLSWAEIKTLS